MTVRYAIPKDVPACHLMIVELAIFEREAQAVINTIESLQKDHESVAFALYYFGYST